MLQGAQREENNCRHFYTYLAAGMGFLSGSGVKESACNARDTKNSGLVPWSGRSPGGGNGSPLQYYCLENLHGQRSLAGYSL